MKIIIQCLLLICLIIAGCATSNVSKDHVIEESAGTGIVIGSLTQDIDVPAATNAKVYIDGAVNDVWNQSDGKNKLWIETKPENFVFGTIGFKSQFEGVDGRIFVLELPVGEHYFTSWFVSTGNATITPRQNPPIKKFYIEENKAVYVGNIHMSFFTGKNLLGLTSVNGGFPKISDESERDIEIFKQEYPELAKLPLNIKPIQVDKWVSSFDTEKEFIPIYIPAN